MTIAVDSTRKSGPYAGNSVATSFAFDYKAFAKTELRVVLAVVATGVESTLTLDVDYSVALNADQNVSPGGSITYPLLGSPMTSANTLTLIGNTLANQSTDLQNMGGFLPEVIENAIDKVTMLVQQVRAYLTRSMLQPVSDTAQIGQLPAKTTRASKFLVFDANGDPQASAGSGTDTGLRTDLADQADVAKGAGLVGIAAGTNLAAGTVRSQLLAIVADGWVALSRIGAGIFTADATGRGKFANLFVSTTLIDALAVTAAKIAGSAVDASKLATSAAATGRTMLNGTLVATVNAGALTLAIKTLAGADPSAADPVYVLVRSATAATGDYAVLTLTAATSLVVSSGSTLGAANSVAFRGWIVGFNDASTFRMGVINCVVSAAGSGSGRDVTSIYPLGQFPLASSTAEGGAGAADSAQVFYTGAAVASKAYEVLGYFTYEAGLAAAGTYASAPTRLELYHRGAPLPGSVVQNQRNQTGAMATGATAIPDDDTIPQNTEGDQYMSQAITSSSAANVLRPSARLSVTATAAPLAFALFQDAVANALTAAQQQLTTSGDRHAGALEHQMLAGTTSAITFKLRAGNASGATTTFNGTAGARKLGGVLNSYMSVEEIMA